MLNLPAARPTVLGLSHLYGEAGDLDGQLAYWKSAGLAEEFAWELPVTEEKNAGLLARPSNSVSLRYLRWTGIEGAPGLEWLRHDGGTPAKSADPLLTVFLKAPRAAELKDSQGNRVVLDPGMSCGVTVVARVPDCARAGALLERLGLRASPLAKSEAALLGASSLAWSASQPLFPKLSFRIALMQDSTAPLKPMVDRPGLTGLSLWTPSLDEAASRVALTARQRIEDRGAIKEVAFYSGDGLLLELLQATRKTS